MAKQRKKPFFTSIGGQALIEGIMMRGPDKTAMVVRNQEGGLEAKESPYIPLKQRAPILALPFLRGVVSFVLSMKEGMKAMTWSAEFFPEEEGEPSKMDAWLDKHLGKNAEKIAVGVGVVLGLVLALGLFTFLPTLLAGLLETWIGEDGLVRNLVETGIRLVILLGYMLLVSQMKDIKRVFGYHGAEHKSIACYEAGDELTVENVRKHSRFHPRCGTSFLLMVVLISMVFFLIVGELVGGFIDMGQMFNRVTVRLAILPLVVAFAYEINRLLGMHDNWFTRIIRAPGIGLQHITTKEPDDSMIEVGIEAIKRVLPQEQGTDKWGKAD